MAGKAGEGLIVGRVGKRGSGAGECAGTKRMVPVLTMMKVTLLAVTLQAHGVFVLRRFVLRETCGDTLDPPALTVAVRWNILHDALILG